VGEHVLYWNTIPERSFDPGDARSFQRLESFSLREGEVLTLDLRAPNFAHLVGQVLTGSKPASEADVFLRSLVESGETCHARTDMEGRFSIDSIRAGGYEAVITVQSAIAPFVERVELANGAFVRRDFMVHGGRIQGVVTGSDGNPIVGASIQLADANSGRSQPSPIRAQANTLAPRWNPTDGALEFILARAPIRSLTTDTSGRYEIECLPPGTYQVIVVQERFACATSDMIAITSDEDVAERTSVLDPAAQIMVTVRSRTNETPLRGRGVTITKAEDVSQRQRTDRNGVARFGSLASGDYMISLEEGSGELNKRVVASRTITVTAGQVAEVMFDD